MQRRSNRSSLRIVDALCGCIVAGSLAGFIWFTAFREDVTASEIHRLTRLIHNARQDLRAVHEAQRGQRSVLAARRAELAETGQLPRETPIEIYFQTLSTFASEHRLRVVRHNPLASRYYPGLLEQRYAYEVAGSFSGLVGFLKSIEEADFWADVGYLKVERGRGSKNALSDERIAVLGISLFSARDFGAAGGREGA